MEEVVKGCKREEEEEEEEVVDREEEEEEGEVDIEVGQGGMESQVQMKEKEQEGVWQKWMKGEEDKVWIEEEVEEVQEEMVLETDKKSTDGDPVLQAESGHHQAVVWAIKHWKNSL